MPGPLLRLVIVAIVLPLVAESAHAQQGAGSNQGTPATTPAPPADPGRYVPDARGSLSGRGGADPTHGQNSFAATIGTPIGSTYNETVGYAIGTPR